MIHKILKLFSLARAFADESAPAPPPAEIFQITRMSRVRSALCPHESSDFVKDLQTAGKNLSLALADIDSFPYLNDEQKSCLTDLSAIIAPVARRLKNYGLQRGDLNGDAPSQPLGFYVSQIKTMEGAMPVLRQIRDHAAAKTDPAIAHIGKSKMDAAKDTRDALERIQGLVSFCEIFTAPPAWQRQPSAHQKRAFTVYQ